MSKYTTGEIAKLCGVSVRTVQYYDDRNLISPSELSEGGRRLYSEEDLRKMKSICFLRELGFSIKAIGELFSEKDPHSVFELLILQQEELLEKEMQERKERLERLADLRKGIETIPSFSVETIGDIAKLMESKKKLAKMRWLMVLTGIPIAVLQWTSIVLWITKGLWWLFVVWACIAIQWGIVVSVYYFRNVAYICPQCHEVFRPSFKEAFFAHHTPTTRRLTCPHCGHKGMCVETYAEHQK